YNGFICTILCSKTTQSYQKCEIHGEKGTIVFDSSAELTNGKLIKTATKEEMLLESENHPNNMVYEAKKFVEIVKTQDNQAYGNLRELSYNVLTITEEVRKENGILFGNEM